MPPYSPDFNEIEYHWFAIKSIALFKSFPAFL
ncbi:hypothetical protein [Candidatus Mesenet endosymbiont of Phosphuga atrata]